MADKRTTECFEYVDIKKAYAFWKAQWKLLDSLYENGKQPIVLHAHFLFDTLAANLADVDIPTNEVLNFGTPQQIFIRSSAAADQSLSVTIIGQNAAGSFGIHTFTTNATNGTTAVDCGTWMCILAIQTGTTAAGNIIIDDDGASTTVFFTLALGVNPGTGIMYVPDGYYGAILDSRIDLLDCGGYISGNAADDVPDAIFSQIGDVINQMADQKHPNVKGSHPTLFDEQEEIQLEYRYDAAVISSVADVWIVLWEKPSS